MNVIVIERYKYANNVITVTDTWAAPPLELDSTSEFDVEDSPAMVLHFRIIGFRFCSVTGESWGTRCGCSVITESKHKHTGLIYRLYITSKTVKQVKKVEYR